MLHEPAREVAAVRYVRSGAGGEWSDLHYPPIAFVPPNPFRPLHVGDVLGVEGGEARYVVTRVAGDGAAILEAVDTAA